MKPEQRKIASWAVLLAGMVLVAVGCFRALEVYTWRSKHRRVKQTERITEFQFTEDTTFSGLLFDDGFLYTNYDRSAKGGKKACPT